MSRSFLAALAALAVSGLAAPTLAADSYVDSADAPRLVVNAQVDFRDEAAVEVLYSKLRRAAASTCDSYRARSRVTQADVACNRRVLDEAVRKVDRPILTAMHDGSYRRDVRLAARARP